VLDVAGLHAGYGKIGVLHGSIFASAAPKSSRFSVRMERARQRCCAASRAC
jgi:hypothetical protein